MRVRLEGFDEFAAKASNQVGRMARLEATMDAYTGLIWAAVVKGTPVGVTSMLRGSWRTETLRLGSSVVGLVGSPLLYSEVMERGRRPGSPMPPPSAIATWVARKLGPDVSPFVVARAIGRRGIQGRHMLEMAIELTRPAGAALFGGAVSVLLETS